MKKDKPDLQKVRSMLMLLSDLLDPIGLRTHIIEESKIGKIKHHAGDWGYLHEYMGTYARQSNPEDVIALLQGMGLNNDFDTAKALLKYDKLID
jgi:hypothetical protein